MAWEHPQPRFEKSRTTRFTVSKNPTFQQTNQKNPAAFPNRVFLDFSKRDQLLSWAYAKKHVEKCTRKKNTWKIALEKHVENCTWKKRVENALEKNTWKKHVEKCT